MEMVVRVFVIYLFVFIGLRVLGKREFGQLSPIELVTLLMIPEIVSQAFSAGDNSLTNALVGVATLLVAVFLTSMLQHRFQKVERIVAGEPTVLVHRGSLRERAMNLNRITPDEIFSEMHKCGLTRLDEVEWAILEGDGMISVVPAVRGQLPNPPSAGGREQKGV